MGAARERYCAQHSSFTPTDLMKWTQQQTHLSLKQDFMLSGDLPGQTLAMLIRICGANRVLEIGTYTGYTALAMAYAVYANDPSKAKVVCLDSFVDEPESEKLCRLVLEEKVSQEKIREVVELRKVGSAMDALKEMTEQFDFVFIDADKESQEEYVRLIVEREILKQHGLIVVDNTLWYSKVLQKSDDIDPVTQVIQTFNEAILKKFPNFEVLMLPVRDGITVIRLA